MRDGRDVLVTAVERGGATSELFIQAIRVGEMEQRALEASLVLVRDMCGDDSRPRRPLDISGWITDPTIDSKIDSHFI